MQNSARNYDRLFLKTFSGYTIIELIVVVATMAILFSLGLANYRDYQRRQYLESAVRMVKADLQLAREWALVGKQKEGCSNINGYFLKVVESDSRYMIGIDADCGPGNNCKNIGTDCEKVVRLPSDISISINIGGQKKFTFLTLARGIDRASIVEITLTDTKTGVSKIIKIDTNGRIY